MTYKKIFLSGSLLTLLASTSCANSPHLVNNDKNQTISSSDNTDKTTVLNSTSKSIMAHNFVEIEFSHGSSELSESAKSSLNAIVDQAKKDGKIDEVIVLAWSDQEYPSKSLKRLPKQQRQLAKKRNASIKEFMKNLRSINVDTYNMAEQPNALSKWFNTTDNKLKDTFLAAGLPTTADASPIAGKASKAVILVKVK